MTMEKGNAVEVEIRIVVQNPPRDCRFTVQRGKKEPRAETDAKTSNGRALTFDVPVTARQSRSGALADFGGPFVQGSATERFIYVASPGRRAKVRLDGIPWTMILAATEVARPIVGIFEGEAKDGGAFCASVHPVQPWRVG
jgi:hypothetical protein